MDEEYETKEFESDENQKKQKGTIKKIANLVLILIAIASLWHGNR